MFFVYLVVGLVGLMFGAICLAGLQSEHHL
jgi:hypothetical protein